ncbi:1-acyl-sn-glycerol-3-phosphate acyltransferase beta-like [Gordionus sp. m RMFG-2023]|uniref:1-acyl-sn-glycerol-3-phosphate acyltransferase beta-like n=1 Tax=Gordionus sp. m RMFG-2023 TaxID=3053472 RepID=UPI0031FC8C9D
MTMTIALGTWPLFLFRRKDLKNLSFIFKTHNKICQIFGIDIEIIDKENLLIHNSCVIISNHQSSLDLLALAKIWPDNCTIIAKKELRFMIPIEFFSNKTRIMFINRTQTDKSKMLIDELARNMKKNHIKIWVFPEGTRNNSPNFLPFKKGAFHLAIKAQVPICPVVISSYRPFYSKEAKRFEKGKITMICLPPIMTTSKTQEGVNDLIHDIKSAMENTFRINSHDLNLKKNL